MTARGLVVSKLLTSSTSTVGTTGVYRLEVHCVDVVVAACSIFEYVHDAHDRVCLLAFANDSRCR